MMLRSSDPLDAAGMALHLLALPPPGAPETTSLQEESNRMSTREIPASEALRSLAIQGRILGSMLLLGGVWCTLFLWGLVLTERWLSWRAMQSAPPAGWQAGLATTLQQGAFLYLPACAPVLISLALFFYRAPRVRGPLVLPLEFAVTTLCFVGINLLSLELLHYLAQVTWMMPPRTAPPIDWGVEPAVMLAEVGFALTLVMLGGLFWLQASGQFWQRFTHWRHQVDAD
jgi:hypothetical protein